MLKNFLSTRAKKKQSQIVVVASFPKSGSTFLTRKLAALPSCELTNICWPCQWIQHPGRKLPRASRRGGTCPIASEHWMGSMLASDVLGKLGQSTSTTRASIPLCLWLWWILTTSSCTCRLDAKEAHRMEESSWTQG